MTLKWEFSNTCYYFQILYQSEKSQILTLKLFKILLMTTGSSLIAEPKLERKAWISFKESLFCGKLLICKHVEILLVIPIQKKSNWYLSEFISSQLTKYEILMAAIYVISNIYCIFNHSYFSNLICQAVLEKQHFAHL